MPTNRTPGSDVWLKQAWPPVEMLAIGIPQVWALPMLILIAAQLAAAVWLQLQAPQAWAPE